MDTTETKQTQKILRKREVLAMLGISDPSLYRWEISGQFPKRLQLGGNSVGWLLSEVEAWIAGKAAERNTEVV